MKNFQPFISIFLFFSFLQTGCYKDEYADAVEPYFFEQKTMQPDGNPFDEYSGVPDSSKEVFYLDFFINGDNWFTGQDGAFSASVSGGFYHINNNDETIFRWVTDKVSLDYNRNFEVETEISIQSSFSDDGGGLMIGGADSDFMCLLIDDEGRFAAMSYEDGSNKFTNYRSWTDGSNFYSPGQQALLTIRKVQDKCYFFVNRHFIGMAPADASLDDTIGFIAKGDVRFQSDFIRASWLNL